MLYYWLRATDERAWMCASPIKGIHGGYSFYSTTPPQRSDKTILTSIADTCNCKTKCRIVIILTPKDAHDLSTSICILKC